MTMEWTIGQVVLATAGRDKGKFLAVTCVEDERVWVCNGKDRPLERAKAKNPKHLQQTQTVLSAQAMATNRNLKKALRELTSK